MTTTTTETATKPQTKTVNQLDPEAIAAAGAALVENPALAAASFRVATKWSGGVRSRSRVTGYALGGQQITRAHTIDADEPTELLGGDSAPNPQELLLAALNACMSVGFVAGATMRGIELESLEIDSALSLDLRGAFGLADGVPAGAETMTYTIRVKANAPREVLEEIHQEVIGRSPNRFHLTRPIELTSKLVCV